jgi:hypothetical protein
MAPALMINLHILQFSHIHCTAANERKTVERSENPPFFISQVSSVSQNNIRFTRNTSGFRTVITY